MFWANTWGIVAMVKDTNPRSNWTMRHCVRPPMRQYHSVRPIALAAHPENPIPVGVRLSDPFPAFWPFADLLPESFDDGAWRLSFAHCGSKTKAPVRHRETHLHRDLRDGWRRVLRGLVLLKYIAGFRRAFNMCKRGFLCNPCATSCLSSPAS